MQLTTAIREHLVRAGGIHSDSSISAFFSGAKISDAMSWLESIGLVSRSVDGWQALDRWGRLIPYGGVIASKCPRQSSDERTPGRDKGLLPAGQPVSLPRLSDGSIQAPRKKNDLRAKAMPKILAKLREGALVEDAFRSAGYSRLSTTDLPQEDRDHIVAAISDAVSAGRRRASHAGRKRAVAVAVSIALACVMIGCIEDPEETINATTTTAPSDSTCTQSKSGAFQVCDEDGK